MKPDKILLFHSWGIGDAVMFLPTVEALTKEYDVSILTTTEINRTIFSSAKQVKRIYVKKSPAELFLFCLHSFGKFNLLVASTGINPKKVQWVQWIAGIHERITSIPQHNEHRIHTNLNAVRNFITVTGKPLPHLPKLCGDNQTFELIDADRLNIGFAIGSKLSQHYKRWGVEKFIALAEKFKDANALFFVGPEEEREKAVLLSHGCTIVQTSLANTMAYIQRLDLLIGNDSGLMHIGYASNITTFTIFGMTDPKEIGGYHRNNHALSLGLNCQPCLNTTKNGICESLDCLAKMSPDYVYERICTKLSGETLDL